MNRSGLVQSKREALRASLTLHETRCVHNPCTHQKLNLFLKSIEGCIVEEFDYVQVCLTDLAWVMLRTGNGVVFP